VGSPFARLIVSDPVPLPFDEGQWVQVRKLTGREIEAAADAHRSGLTSGSARAWPAIFRRAIEKGASDPVVLKALADPLTGYDRFALVRSGLVAWSYPQSVTPIAAKAGKPGAAAVEASDAIEDLDDEAVDFIATEILRLTKPALFLATEEGAEAAQKND
jgi:hypothetical protein